MKKNIESGTNIRIQSWRNRKAIVVLHEATTGPGHDLRDYFLKKGINELLFITHPLLFLKETSKNSSRYEYYKKGRKVITHYAYHWVLPEFLLYIKDFFYTIVWSTTMGHEFNLYVGVGNLNAFVGCILKRFKLVKNTIYYVIDYVPLRFHNKFINSIYHRIEKVAAEQSNWTWNLSPRMIEGRSKKWHKNFSNQLIVPHGVHIKRIKRVSFDKINKREILYMGTITQKQGIQLVIEALPNIVSSITNVKYIIIGKGPYLSELKKRVKQLKLGKYVEFVGYIPDHSIMEDRISRAAVAVALYDKKADINDFTYYADPGKIKNYLGAGVPVIMTAIPYVASEVEKKKCGFIILYDKNKLSKLLVSFLTNEIKMKKYRFNALRFAKKFDWDTIFTNALNGQTFTEKYEKDN